MVVVASPAYLAECPAPATPADLKQHRYIRGRLGSGPIWRWGFYCQGEAFSVDVDGPLVLDDTVVMVEAALGRAGLASVPTLLAIASRPVEVLADWTPSYSGLCLYYSGRRLVPPGLRALIDLARITRRT